jgi:hypothetical protein
MQKCETLRQPLPGYQEQEKKSRNQEKKKDELPKIVATYVYASSKGQLTHSARTKISFPGLSHKCCPSFYLSNYYCACLVIK